MNVGFLISSWDSIDPATNSTLSLIQESVMRGHKTCVLSPKNLTIRNNYVFGRFRIIQPMSKCPENPVRFFKTLQMTEKMLPLRGFDALFVRNKPPINNLMLNFLDCVKDDVFIVNDVDGMRKANNKTYTTSFHDPENTFLPVTHVSKNKEYLLKIIRESESERMILKPLYGHGGSGVIVLEKAAMRNIHSLLDFYIAGSNPDYLVVQEYVEGADRGDVRAILLNGKPVGAARRVPSSEDYRCNVHAGGSVVKHELTKREREICELIAPRLVADGLYLAGVDLINEKLIEVNVLNPGGFLSINEFARIRLQNLVLDFVESAIAERERQIEEKQAALSRKFRSRNEVVNE